MAKIKPLINFRSKYIQPKFKKNTGEVCNQYLLKNVTSPTSVYLIKDSFHLKLVLNFILKFLLF